MSDEPILLRQPLWSIDNTSVDQLLAAPPRLEMHVKAARNDDGSTIAVAVGYGVGPDLDELYGAMLMAAVVVVAINLDTGAIRARRISNPHAFPVSVFLPDAPPDMAQVDEGGENTAAERIGFDLIRYLGMPRDGARYALFAWLDRLVSNTVIVELPASPGSNDAISPPLLTADSIIRLEQVHSNSKNSAAHISERAIGNNAPFAVLAIDAATRNIFAASSLVKAPGVFSADLTGFDRAREPSKLVSWIVVFDGQNAQLPRAMPPYNTKH